jgi:hypothetical protein
MISKKKRTSWNAGLNKFTDTRIAAYGKDTCEIRKREENRMNKIVDSSGYKVLHIWDDELVLNSTLCEKQISDKILQFVVSEGGGFGCQ